MKFIFILYLLFVIGNRASAANYGEKPLVPGETDESDRDFPGWIYDYYDEKSTQKEKEKELSSSPRTRPVAKGIPSTRCDCQDKIQKAVQVEKLKLETIQNECSMDKKQLNTLNKSMRKNLGAIKEDNKALTLSNSGCQAKLLKKDDEITNSLDSRNELTRELINIQGTLTDVSTRLSQCEEDLNEEKRDVVNDANENLAGGGSESMKIRCEKFQILENHWLWTSIVGLSVLILSLIVAIICLKVAQNRHRGECRTRRSEFFIENPNFNLRAPDASMANDSGLPLPQYNSYVESLNLQRGNRGRREGSTQNANFEEVELRDLNGTTGVPNRQPEENNEGVNDPEEIQEIDESVQGAGIAEGERISREREVNVLRAAVNEILSLKEAVFWFGEELNMYRNREVDESTYEEIDGLNSEYNLLTIYDR